MTRAPPGSRPPPSPPPPPPPVPGRGGGGGGAGPAHGGGAPPPGTARPVPADGAFEIPLALGEGETRRIVLEATDRAGHRSAPTTLAVRRDRVAPAWAADLEAASAAGRAREWTRADAALRKARDAGAPAGEVPAWLADGIAVDASLAAATAAVEAGEWAPARAAVDEARRRGAREDEVPRAVRDLLAAWSDVEVASAKAVADDWAEVASRLESARRRGMPEARLPRHLVEGVARYEAPPQLRVLEPRDGATVATSAVTVRGTMTSGRRGDRVLVQGSRASVDAGGRFEKTVVLRSEGRSDIEVAVEDDRGNARTRTTVAVTYARPAASEDGDASPAPSPPPPPATGVNVESPAAAEARRIVEQQTARLMPKSDRFPVQFATVRADYDGAWSAVERILADKSRGYTVAVDAKLSERASGWLVSKSNLLTIETGAGERWFANERVFVAFVRGTSGRLGVAARCCRYSHKSIIPLGESVTDRDVDSAVQMAQEIVGGLARAFADAR